MTALSQCLLFEVPLEPFLKIFDAGMGLTADYKSGLSLFVNGIWPFC